MTEQEYNERMDKIQSEYEAAKRQLYIDYAKDQQKFKVGDIIKDNRGIMMVDKIGAVKGYGLPIPVYEGIELKKDLKPRKDGNRVAIYGNDAELIKSAQQ